MPSLKDLRQRITSVKSTRKITAAMKMVAASKLRRAREAVEAARPYAKRIEQMLSNLIASLPYQADAPLLTGTGSYNAHLIIIITANRGLCGAFNSAVTREARSFAADLIKGGRSIQILCVGRKCRDQIKRDYDSFILNTIESIGKQRITFVEADAIGRQVVALFETGSFDVCTMIFNHFQSATNQVVTRQQLIPFPISGKQQIERQQQQDITSLGVPQHAVYEYEPSEEEILASIALRNVSVQIFLALLESVASEQGARMIAMDNATRNASDIITDLTVTYNRTRQASITKELIEIISGAEVL